jgi:hypothetical protein
MANKHRGEIPIKLDKRRTLRLDFNMLADLEENYGINVMKTLTNLEKMPFSSIRRLVWAGLLHELPDLTVSEAGSLIQKYSTLEKASQAVSDAIQCLAPADEGNGKNEPSGLNGVGIA